MTRERFEQIRTLNRGKAEGHVDSAVQHVRELIEYIDAAAPPAPAQTWDTNLKLWNGLTSSTPQRGLIVAAHSQKRALQLLNRAGHYITSGQLRNHWNNVGHLEHYRAIATEEGVWIGQSGYNRNGPWTRMKLMGLDT